MGRALADAYPEARAAFDEAEAALPGLARIIFDGPDEDLVLTQNAQVLGDQVQFVGVVFQDDEKKITDFLRARGWAYPTLVDERGKTAIAYGVGGVPETFFLDKSGKIVAKFDGPMSSEILQSNLQKALQ